MLVLGTVALGVINFARFRRGFLAVLGLLGRTVRSILVDLPARLFDLPAMRRLFASAPVAAAWRFAIKPGLAAAAVLAAGAGCGVRPDGHRRDRSHVVPGRGARLQHPRRPFPGGAGRRGILACLARA